MYRPLHLKYRPKNLQELVGQDYIKTALTNAVTASKIASAYLFAGPRGTGKTSTARILAKSLNCLESKTPTINPCDKCSSCKAIDSGSSLDVSEIDAASHNGVDDARELIEHSNFAPAMSRSRIFILDEAHMLTTASQNALLKCIEEPPPHVVFILCTTEAHKVLPTVVSRCQTFNFRAMPLAAIVGQLEKVSKAESIAVAEAAMLAIARTSDGGLRDALQLLSQLSLLNSEITPTQVIEVSGGISEKDLTDLIKAICSSDVLGLLQLARTLVDSGKTPKLILSSLLAVYRDLLLVKVTPTNQNLIAGTIGCTHLKKLAARIDFETLDTAFTQLHKSESQLRVSTNSATWFEVCLLNLMPKMAVPISQNNTAKNSPNSLKLSAQQNGHSHRLGRVGSHNAPTPNISSEEPEAELKAIWESVVEAVKPTHRGLLSKAELVKQDADSWVLTVAPNYADKFKANLELVQRIIGKALGRSITVTIAQQEKFLA
jgi:DNA polymerase-3 subunit gamma/tau